MTETDTRASAQVEIEVRFCGETWTATPGTPFRIGRVGDLALDDNPFLHRSFLVIEHAHGMWWLRNVGSRLHALVTDGVGGIQAYLPPGGSLPIVFAVSVVLFTAGPTTYEFAVHSSEPVFAYGSGAASGGPLPAPPTTPLDEIELTIGQRLLVLALAEPVLRGGTGVSAIPTSARAAARLDWTRTRFNRKLDNVCDKLDRAGVPGLHGGAGDLALNRRARLVEYAVASRMVTADQLGMLDGSGRPLAATGAGA